MPARDDTAKLRGLCGELGFSLLRLPPRDTWKLIDDKTEKAVMNPVFLAEGFRTPDALRFLTHLKRKREREAGK